MPEFKSWGKIPRDNPFVVTITEKMDGTNACIIIEDGVITGVQSRKRMITPERDNYGFAQWVEDNTEDLLGLGDGYHYGEWAGLGINKNPHDLEGKEFFLFNTFKWNPKNLHRPKCCSVVPILFEGVMTNATIDILLHNLAWNGSGTGSKPEGIIVFYHTFKSYTKHTIISPKGKWRDDEIPKQS